MAYYAQTQKYSLGERLTAGIGHILERAAARHAHYRIYRDSLWELRSLSDRDLADIGIHRSMLKSVAREAADKQVAL